MATHSLRTIPKAQNSAAAQPPAAATTSAAAPETSQASVAGQCKDHKVDSERSVDVVEEFSEWYLAKVSDKNLVEEIWYILESHSKFYAIVRINYPAVN